jgi:hypothetical protein
MFHGFNGGRDDFSALPPCRFSHWSIVDLRGVRRAGFMIPPPA